MSVILDNEKIFYAAVPKIACTSIKTAFFEIENGFAFKPFRANGKWNSVHDIGYGSRLREFYPEARIADYYRVALVRNPVARFLSAYGNRVIHHQELSMQKAGKALEQLDLAPTPSLDLFIDRYEDYLQAHPSILHHTRPLVDFLGSDPEYFSRLYTLKQMDAFVADISERVGRNMVVGHHQTGGPKFTRRDLTRARLEKVRALYEKDYENYGAFFG